MAPRIRKPDPDRVYVCVMSYACEHAAYGKGARLRGTNPEVLAHPTLWAEDGLDDAERQTIARQRFGEDTVVA